MSTFQKCAGRPIPKNDEARMALLLQALGYDVQDEDGARVITGQALGSRMRAAGAEPQQGRMSVADVVNAHPPTGSVGLAFFRYYMHGAIEPSRPVDEDDPRFLRALGLQPKCDTSPSFGIGM